MNKLTVALPGREYDILIGGGLLRDCGPRVRAALPRAEKLALVSDDTVAPLYARAVTDSLTAAGFAVRLFSVPAGEGSKSAARLAELWEGFAAFSLTRSDGVIALGGGVVGDLAGFAAATYLRGVPFVQIPTTLLAQVDSSVGGKVAIDLTGGKNLAGTFHQPRLVLIDPDTLTTLPDAVFADGMAEVVKYGCIRDRDFFDFLAARPTREALMAQIEPILAACCRIKADLVARDEGDHGVRMLLNFGHTAAHAFERAGNYAQWTHGQAVAAGMVLAVRLGINLGITPADALPPLEKLLYALSLPTSIPCPAEVLARAVSVDKKGRGGGITVILLSRLGEAVPVMMDKDALLARLAELTEG